MNTPKPISLKVVLKILQKNGFSFARQKGSHARYEKKASHKTLKVTIKVSKKEIPYGTFRSILSQSDLKESDFRKK